MMLKGKTALVTGGSQGIGKAITGLFLEEGAEVFICSRDPVKAAAALEEIFRDTGRKAEFIQADVSQRPDIERVVESVMERCGRIDILVNNAGIQEFVPFLEMDEQLWDRHFAVNVKSAFLFSQAIAKRMIPLGGCKIINMSSDSGVAPVPVPASAYCSSKSALIGLSRCIAKELGRYGVYCNAICPGGIEDTGMLESYHSTFGGKDEEDADLTALGHLGKPEDVARVALFFASELSNHVTGERIMVTGGDIMTQ
ncbi:MAG TPA: SDR family NAD(P)-dependent oxidoreductase [Spirochaetia bacterium]|nr:SDR family NAD(P)-dependent oxidoreductase [Spirochaetia bacterium]